MRLKREFIDVLKGRISSEYQTNDSDSSWRPTKKTEYSGYEESTGSVVSKKKRKKVNYDDDSEGEDSQHESSKKCKSSMLWKFEDDVDLIEIFIRTQYGGLKVKTKSLLLEHIENAKISRDLKVPPIDSFGGYTDPSDFINLFDGCIDFFGNSEAARYRFFSTCLKGTPLHWFNNLQPRSIYL